MLEHQVICLLGLLVCVPMMLVWLVLEVKDSFSKTEGFINGNPDALYDFSKGYENIQMTFLEEEYSRENKE